MAIILLAAASASGADCPLPQAGQVRIGDQVWEVRTASTGPERERGLSGLERLPAGQGMWFVFAGPVSPGFWMKGMHFPIDIVWIGADRQVLGVTPMHPCRTLSCQVIYPPAPVTQVLEVNLGEFHGAAGMRVDWECR